MRDDPELWCSVYRPRLYEWDGGGPAHPDAQFAAFSEITDQLLRHLRAALKEDDVWKFFRICARAERLLGIYTSENFDQLLPLQRQLQNMLRVAYRRARRIYIRRVLTGRDGDKTPYDAEFESRKWDGDPEVAEDVAAVERALNEGTRLFEGLRSEAG